MTLAEVAAVLDISVGMVKSRLAYGLAALLRRQRKEATMTDQDVLRKALNEIDSLRYRWGWTFGIMAALSQAAWIALGDRRHDRRARRQLILLCRARRSRCTVFGGVFMLVLLIFRMTHKLLQAIEVFSRRV